MTLFETCPTCRMRCQVQKIVRGTFLSVDQSCLHCLYNRKWMSQPLLGSTPAGNLQLSAAILFSGSSFIQTNKVLNTMRVKTISSATFHVHARSYLQPTIFYKWKTDQEELLQSLRQKETVSFAGDMRADSPGHSAKYGCYSMMELDSNVIVDIQMVQSNEVGGSGRMEKEGLKRSLQFLEESGLTVGCLVTDRHPQIQKYIREEKPAVIHYYDVWHVAKSMTNYLFKKYIYFL
ncbi:uncharacterized protein LOC135254919 [Anguilla rostrata]|uniref:uncharacterized protein LOC135254919 n=1 Tax=Anguilla rostrata TaxID=7938 RepID=UPI0030CE8D69